MRIIFEYDSEEEKEVFETLLVKEGQTLELVENALKREFEDMIQRALLQSGLRNIRNRAALKEAINKITLAAVEDQKQAKAAQIAKINQMRSEHGIPAVKKGLEE